MPIDGYTATWHDEYLYRRLFPMTHAQFEAEPRDAVRWMLEINRLYMITGAVQPGQQTTRRGG